MRLVLGYYPSAEHADEALTELQRNRFRRSAVVHAEPDGRLRIPLSGLSPYHRLVAVALVVAAASILTSFLGGTWRSQLLLVSGSALAAWFATPWWGLGLRSGLLRQQGRCVLPGESLVVVQATEAHTPEVIEVMRRIADPSVFVLRPELKFASSLPAAAAMRAPVALSKLADCAAELAPSHRLDASTRSRSLLPTLRACEAAIERARADLAEAARLAYGISHAAEWLLDNTYLIRSHIAEIRHNLPASHNKILPVVADKAAPVRFRIYLIAADLMCRTGYRMSSEAITGFLTAYQEEAPLTIAELWVLPLMLRLVLLQKLQRLSESASLRQHQKELADFWANRLLRAAQRGAAPFNAMVAELDRDGTELTPHFIARLGEQLHKEEPALAPIQKWIEAKTGFRLADMHLREHAEEASDLMGISTAIGSLRHLAEVQYPALVEAASRIEIILSEDPSGIHLRSDFATRDRCRQVVELAARQSGTSEWAVARLAVTLAQAGAAGSREGCVAYYLLDEGREVLERRVARKLVWQERRLRFLQRHPASLYLGSIGVLTLAVVGMFLQAIHRRGVYSPWTLTLLGVLAILPSSELALYLTQMWLARFVPPRTLPKMSFEKGIPDECRTLVVVPMMFLTPDSIHGEIEKLEVRYLGNPLPNLSFSLLADFTDAGEREMPEDEGLLGLAVKGIEQLNARHGAGTFVLFARRRLWCETEERWIGWERKRGKLEDLNRYLNGGSYPDFVHAGTAPEGVRYVITLDADTQLPHGSARRLIETIAHPLNRVEFTPDRRNRLRGYTIIQPRVSITLPSATASRFTRLFTDARGSDPYCRAVSDIYQDVFGEGIYHGKGIYDVQAFHAILEHRFPDQRLLSHDLIEGVHVGVGLATDVELFENFPYDYVSYSKRQHRWIRGDWQIASWVFPRVPGGNQQLAPNPLTVINRWKIFDNLRRSLLAPGSLVFLVCGWALHAEREASTLAAFVLLVPLFFQLLRRLAQRWSGDVRALHEASSDLNRAVVMAAFLPHQAYLSLDAIVRVLYRLRVSRRHLLEWQTAEVSHLTAATHVDLFRAQFFLISGVAAVVLVVLGSRGFFWERAWLPFLLLWVAAPAVQHWIGWQRRAVRRLERVNGDDRRYLRAVARETWRYFDDLVCQEHNWLPPDNSQEALRIEVAGRTSPTNIGMWLMSAVAAHDLGFLTPAEMVGRCASTMETIDKLERCEGHILNWYDTRTLEALQPRYISTVDSGNLIASLWVLEQACQELETQPQLEDSALRGLADTLAVVLARFPPDHTNVIPMETLQGLFREESSGAETMDRIRLAAEPARKLKESLRWSTSETDERTYWFSKLEEQVQGWIAYFDRYLRWADVLLAPPDEFLRPLGARAIRERQRLLRHLPTWGELSRGDCVLPTILPGVEIKGLPPHLKTWLADLAAALESARTLAAEFVGRTKRLAQKSEALAASIDMGFLYDPERRLFSIGYSVGGPVTFNAHYDLLASEARLTSLVAIAKGDVPMNHWLALGRPYTTSDGQVLLSWSGTMFEYLMPLLFMRGFRNSLLENACAAAVQCQIDYARQRGVPWGISESAYSGLDSNQIYQYHAFGVPSLGLKRGLEDDLVVAPYATALALLIEPLEAIRNLKRLEHAGMYGRRGFYEAMDYTRQQDRQGGNGVIVYTYMAHHQGMSLMAIDNVLNGGILRQRFHADRRIKAVEPLLFERIPPQPSLLVHHPSDHVLMRPIAEPAAPPYRVLDEDTLVPRVHLLGNGRYAVMMTNSGAGYSRWSDLDLTRWCTDSTRDNWGTFFYLKDEGNESVWSATHQPLNVKDPAYTAIFSPDRAEFRRRRRGIESHVDVTVSPEDDVEIRRVTLTNHGLRSRRIELSSVTELSLAPHDADRTHPAFSKLFIQTEAIPELRALLAWRRPRSPEERPVWIAQFLVESSPSEGTYDFETDRGVFLGRGRSWGNPAMAVRRSAGYVLDPVFAVKREFLLEPRRPRQVAFIMAAAESREELMRLIVKYRDVEICGRTFDLAWSHAQLEYRYLGIQGDAAFRFDELASHLLFPNSQFRAPLERLRRNVLGQASLWAYGISGDLPLVAVSVFEAQGLGLVRELLVAQTYWRLRGLKADLVILNREPSGYDQPLHVQLMRLVEAHSLHTGINQPGGVFLRRADQIPEEDLNLILTVAQATLGSIRGPLQNQLVSSAERPPLPAPLLPIRKADEPAPGALPGLSLQRWNGLGGFTPDGREYVVDLATNLNTPLPWINVMANPSFGALVSESGSGCCWYGNSQANRLISWNNDPIADASSEALYIRDEETGTFWSPTALPVRESAAYRARHGQGYTEFEHTSHELEQTLLTFVPAQLNREDPLRIQRLKLRNRSPRVRRLSITAYLELVLGNNRESTQMHVSCTWDQASGALFARNTYHRDYGSRITFAALLPTATSYTSDRTEFLGRNGSAEAPAALKRSALSNRTGVGLDPCGALQTKLDLGPGQEKTLILLLGQADDVGHARRLLDRYRDAAAVELARQETVQRWDRLLGAVQVETPLASVNVMMNRWLLYQSLSCRIWGRSALYQSSGAYGFRDQLQDSLALVYTSPDITRTMILRAASRQFLEGDVQHWWHPGSGEGIRTRCTDDLLWLPYAVSQYVAITGDDGFLDAQVSFLDGPQLQEGQLETHFNPVVSLEQATLFEHCRRAIEKGTTQGAHGLPLIGTGDWNDGLNSVGDEGKGESVWMAWFLLDVWNRFSSICDKRKETVLAAQYRASSVEMKVAVEAAGWDGHWYRRGYFDDGTALGSQGNEEARIDSLAQSWSVISGAGDPVRSVEAMNSALTHLVRRDQKLVLLLTPPFDHSLPHPGYIMGYPPGVRENGGQYTHAALWLAMALARMGKGGDAVEVLQMLNPIELASTPKDCTVYRTEPYAVAADVYSLESQPGRGGWTWYTGSAGWMYRVWLEEVLGFKLRGNRLSLDPAIPDDWPGFAITFRFGETNYRIEVENGELASEKVFVLEDDHMKHTLRVVTRRRFSDVKASLIAPPVAV